ncbi:hypothetical protein PLUTE_a2142 [Pseudoalteromonas luteoviolacea DSM 6061]|nr:hypothetical protein [Pseudoalteromonas luteoviolacea DSM 6061]
MLVKLHGVKLKFLWPSKKKQKVASFCYTHPIAFHLSYLTSINRTQRQKAPKSKSI